MKQIIKYLAIVPILIAVYFVFSTAQTHATVVPETCYVFDELTGTITDYDTTDVDCTLDPDIPSSIGGVVVVNIGSNAFFDNELTSVTIPNSVTYIGVRAFADNQLTAITIPNSITVIESEAFADNQLTAITIPNSITVIENRVFSNNQLTTVTIPGSVTMIGDSAFQRNHIASISIPSSVILIGPYAFSSNQLTTVTIPSSVTMIYPQTFAFNKIATITIPSSVTSIGSNAFMGQSAQAGAAIYELESGDPDRVQPVLDATWYTRLFTEDPANSANFTDDMFLESDAGGDSNGDGDLTDSIGGHIVNPSSVSLEYVAKSGAELSSSVFSTGAGLSNYLAASNTGNDLDLYYRSGQTHSFAAPAINGYNTPAAVQLVLSPGENSHTFVYQSNVNQAQALSSGGLASTGSNQSITMAVGLSIVLMCGIASVYVINNNRVTV